MRFATGAAAALILTACATPRDHHTQSHTGSGTVCKTDPCVLTVTVRGCSNIKTTPRQVDLPAGHRPRIVWEIAQMPGMSYVFTREGIEFKQGSGAGFASPGGANSTRFVWHSNNAARQPHGYNVNVTQDGGRTICTEDPTIVVH
jgi:hypothetical protein